MHSAFGGCCQDIRHLDRLLYLRELSGRSLPFSDWRGEHRLDDLSLKMLGGAWHEHLALLVVFVDDARVGARELRGPGHDRAQHGPEIQGGTDRLTDLAERPKLAHRASEILGPGFEFLEQPHVLDGDHRLVGERGHQLDLLGGERLHPGSCQRHHADDTSLPKQGNSQHGAVAADLLRLVKRVLGIY